jgi:AraC-like DNA-binding protein
MDDVAAIPLLFYDQRATIDRDSQVLANRLAQHYPLVDFGPRRGSENSFMHRSSTAKAGDLMLTCGYTTPIQGAIAENQGVAAINLCCGGMSRYRVDGRELQINPRRPLFFSPGQNYCYTVDHFNGAAFHADLSRLRSTASAIAGLGVSERRFIPDLEQAKVLTVEDERMGALIRLLCKQFALLDEPALEHAIYLRYLQIDDLIYRTLALLLCPGLDAVLQAGPHDPVAASRERILEDLLEWMSAHLSEPISLTQLEQRSGYSRRNLQLLFHQRFGCGPIQWVRQQRLERARQALLQPQANDSVATVAARYGFSSLAVFSRDFQARFGLLASDLLREGRRRHG